MIPAHAFDAQRFGLTAASGGPSPARISGDYAAIMAGANPMGASAPPPGSVVLGSLNLGEAEALLIERALEQAKGNRTRAAELLGMSVRTLRNKLNGPKPEGSAV
jgi:DNA-binding NtrC family response regulator